MVIACTLLQRLRAQDPRPTIQDTFLVVSHRGTNLREGGFRFAGSLPLTGVNQTSRERVSLAAFDPEQPLSFSADSTYFYLRLDSRVAMIGEGEEAEILWSNEDGRNILSIDKSRSVISDDLISKTILAR